MLVFYVLTLAACVTANSWVGVEQRIETSLKRLEVFEADGNLERRCTAGVINQKMGYVVTAAHCIPEEQSKEIRVDGVSARRVAVDRKKDLAILIAAALYGSDLSLGAKAPNVGEPIMVAGYALGRPGPIYTFGYITSMTGAGFYEGQLYDAHTAAGMSGGLVLNNRGQLISVHQGSLLNSVGSPWLAYGAWLGELKDFIEPYKP
jgi:S1-C subfamily serine protease